MDYKALFEQTLKENEDLYEELEGKEVLAKAYKEHKIEIMKLQEENKELKKDVKYWKNFALVYWSGNELGNLREAEKGPGGGEVWNEALEKVTNDAGETIWLSQEDLDEINKKCMAD